MRTFQFWIGLILTVVFELETWRKTTYVRGMSKFKKAPRLWFWFALLLLSSVPLFAAVETGAAAEDVPARPTSVLKTYEPGPWSTHRLGFYFGALGDPAPSLVSFNVAFHLNDFFRIHGGVGTLPLIVDTASTYGAGVLYRPLGDRPVSPVFGLAGSALSVRWDKLSGILTTLLGTKPEILKQETYYIGVAKVGLDWQTASGFNAGLGMQLLIAELNLPVPYLHLGWFF